MANLDEEFRRLFGHANPYPFQRKEAEFLLEGKNVVLHAPTGSGKTEAALFPYLLSQRHKRDFPKQMLYAVPMRVLAHQFHDRASEKTPVDLSLRIDLQTGEDPKDHQFLSDMLFCTIDQLLSSFLNIPFSLGRGQANLNAGAVASSFLVFDEFHLLDPEVTLPTVLIMLKMLKGIVPFLLMTATFSTPLLGDLARELGAEVVNVEREELLKMPSQKDRRRFFHAVDQPLTAQRVWELHRQRSIAICNTVDKAQRLFREIKELVGPNGPEIILLHSRFLAEHRRAKEKRLDMLFGEKAKGGSAILVATQVIEVGLNISCERMHTELAPANSILQRAGRLARFSKGEGEVQEGELYVYQVEADEEGKPSYGPYRELASLCKATFQKIRALAGQNVDFPTEARLIDAVHGETDKEMLEQLEAGEFMTHGLILDTIATQDLSAARRLIRNIDSCTILIHKDPDSVREPFSYEGFSVHRSVLLGHLKELEARAQEQGLDWIIKYPKEISEGEEEAGRYEWIPASSREELLYPLLILNPALASYNSEVGFLFEPDGLFCSPRVEDRRTEWEKYSYRQESYQEHVRGMDKVYREELASRLAYAAQRLEERMGLKPSALDKAARLAIALHDVGKLSKEWQDWAHRWQKEVGAPVAEEVMLAHTDSNPDDSEYQAKVKRVGRRPPHAAEGTVATFKILHQLLGAPRQENDPSAKLLRAVLTAIARHHSPATDSFTSFALHPAAKRTLRETLASIGEDAGTATAIMEARKVAAMEMARKEMAGLLSDPLQVATDELLAYFLIVRALRLADQGAMAGRSRGCIRRPTMWTNGLGPLPMSSLPMG